MALREMRVMLALAVVLTSVLRSSQAGEDFPRGLLTVAKEGDDSLHGLSREEVVSRFVTDNMEPRHAVAVVVAGKGSKRYNLLRELTESDEQLRFLAAIGIHFGKGSSLVMHRYRYPSLTYEGKWTRTAIREWLQETSFPPVNMMDKQFSPPKYLNAAPYGTVMIVKELSAQSTELTKALEAYAETHRHKLKFTFFTKSTSTQQFCDTYGIWSNDELLVLEEPRKVSKRTHSSFPGGAKFRLEGVTPASIDRFFHEYAAGLWPQYYKSAFPRGPPIVQHGIRELSGWDFLEVVKDPNGAVLVEFVSQNCASCDEFASTYRDLALRIVAARKKDSTAFSNLTIARIDQSAHEHPEMVHGTPWMRFWPKGLRKRPSDVDARNVEGLLEFLEDNLGQAVSESQTLVDGQVHQQRILPKAEESEHGRVPLETENTGIRLPQPSPEAARGYLRTDEEEL